MAARALDRDADILVVCSACSRCDRQGNAACRLRARGARRGRPLRIRRLVDLRTRRLHGRRHHADGRGDARAFAAGPTRRMMLGFGALARQIERKSGDTIAWGTIDEIWKNLFGWTAPRSNVAVNLKTALQVSTVLACARVLAEGVGQVPC